MKISDNILKSIRGAVAQKDLETIAENHRGKSTAKLTYYRLRPLFYLILIISFVFNAISAVTASALEYDFAVNILHNTTAAVLVTVFIFTLLALVQRYLLVLIFEDISADGKVDFPGLIFGAVVISVTLITMSFYGAGEVVQRTAKAPERIQADVSDLDTQIAAATATIADLKKNRNEQGQIYYLSQKGINRQTDLLEKLNSEKNRRLQNAETQNAAIEQEHRENLTTLSFNFGWVTVATELLLPFCIFFLCWYRVRSSKEFEALFPNNNRPTFTAPVAAPSHSYPFSENTIGFQAIHNRENGVRTGYTAFAQPEGVPVNHERLLKFKSVLNDCQREIANLESGNGRAETVAERLRERYGILLDILPLVERALNKREVEASERVVSYMLKKFGRQVTETA